MDYILIILLIVGYFSMSGRIRILEEKLKSLDPLALKPQPKPQSVLQAIQLPVSEEIHAGLEDATSPQFQVTAPIAASVPKKDTNDNLEFKFGSKIFTWVGALAVIIGLGFFLRFAFQTGLITEVMRIVLGSIFGFIMIGIGFWLRNKYQSYGQVLIGTGLGILYLCIFSSYNFYNLIDQPTALIMMLLVTILGVMASLVTNSIGIAAFAGLGGFLTPFLLSGIDGSPHLLFPYILVLDIGFLIIAFYKLWRPLAFGSFIGTIFVFLAWSISSYNNVEWYVAQVYLTLFFIVFLSVSLVHYLRNQTVEDEGDLTLMVSNATVYFLLSYVIINRNHPDWMGLFTVVLGLIYCFLWVVIRQNDPRDIRFRSFVAGIGFVFFIIAVPIQFEKFVITILWAAEALVLAYMGLKINARALKMSAIALFTIVFVKLISIDSFLDISDAFINIRFVTYIVSIGCFIIAAVIYHYYSHQDDEDNKTVVAYLSVASYVLLQAIFTFEIIDFFNHYWLAIIWSIIALSTVPLAINIRSKVLRACVYITFIVASLRVVFIESSVTLKDYVPFFNGRVLAFIVVAFSILLTAYILIKNREVLTDDEQKTVVPFLGVLGNIILLWLLSVEVLDFFNKKMLGLHTNEEIQTLESVKRVALSSAWLLYSFVLLSIGIAKKLAVGRILALILIGITIFKVFLYDTAVLDNFYRFISYISLGTLLLIIGFLYNRYRESILHFIKREEIV